MRIVLDLLSTSLIQLHQRLRTERRPRKRRIVVQEAKTLQRVHMLLELHETESTTHLRVVHGNLSSSLQRIATTLCVTITLVGIASPTGRSGSFTSESWTSESAMPCLVALHLSELARLLDADLLQIVAGHERAQVLHHQSVRVHEKQGVSQLRLLLLLVVLPLLHVCG